MTVAEDVPLHVPVRAPATLVAVAAAASAAEEEAGGAADTGTAAATRSTGSVAADTAAQSPAACAGDAASTGLTTRSRAHDSDRRLARRRQRTGKRPADQCHCQRPHRSKRAARTELTTRSAERQTAAAAAATRTD